MTQFMWGENGEFGPFSAGKDGYPNSGEVVRFYRVKKGISASEFGELYAKALAAKLKELYGREFEVKPKSRIWVLTMERTNNVPTDITRRRVIAELLGIPAVLLGLSEGLAAKPVAVNELASPRAPRRETLLKGTVAEYQQTLEVYFNGYYTRHGYADLEQLNFSIQQLIDIARQLPEQAKMPVIALLSRYYQFGVMVTREQCQYEQARKYADQAIICAQAAHGMKPSSDLLAIALYRRGIAEFEQAITSPEAPRERISTAQSLIEGALTHARTATPAVRGLVALEYALVSAHTAQTECDRKQVHSLLESSHRDISLGVNQDNEFTKCSLDWYYLTSAEALIAIGDHAEALGQLELAAEMTPLTLPRRFAYMDALRAQAHLALGEPIEAALAAKDALLASRPLKSEFNIARVALVYRQLRQRYRRSREITALGQELLGSHPQLVTV
ncbi:hypothetical protein [Thermogemmatispora sp.]|uniref:hypothetical protein n=1 Tax=Thermogemmatispora sp. TaxID=1968838 RepID=UPI001DEB6151|nr:hypothetical protein [Thermogemmatispora sp.]MBX5451926.1 hypothetical protein [Thermogemmatispora sp.]